MKRTFILGGAFGNDRKIIHINGKGKGVYIWIGKDEEFDHQCFGWVDKRVKELAESILEAIKK